MQQTVAFRLLLQAVEFVTGCAIVDIAAPHEPESVPSAEGIHHMLALPLAAVRADRHRVPLLGRAFAVAPDRVDLDKPFEVRSMPQ